MDEGIQSINKKVASFKRKYYLNLFLKGTTLSLSLLLAYFLFAALLEYNLWLPPSARFLLFSIFILFVIGCLFLFLRKPLRWWISKKGLGEEESARIIGNHFPSVKDRLLNLLQLASTGGDTSLVSASIAQKSTMLEHIAFDRAVDFNENRKYLKFLLIPFGIILILLFVNRNIFTDSTSRIVRFNEQFSPEAPFQFVLNQSELAGYFNEDFVLEVKLKGSAIPDAVYIVSDALRIKMTEIIPGTFQYTFEKLQRDINFQFEASGFYSPSHKIRLINRPELTEMKMILDFPAYLRKPDETQLNAGSVTVPEGTVITWKLGTSHTSKAQISFSEGQPNDMQVFDNQGFSFSKMFKEPSQYSVLLENDKSKNKDQISYSVDIIKDAFPQIVVENLKDSVLYKNVFVGGLISDDYANTQLKLIFRIEKNGKAEDREREISIPIVQGRQQQSFFYRWNLDSVNLNPGDKVSYFMRVWDNDGVNGFKSTQSSSYVFALPTKEELKDAITQSQHETEKSIDKSLTKAKDLKEQIAEAQQRLKGKQTLDWQDKKMLEDLLEQKKSLDETISQLQKENELMEKKKDAFSEQSERIKEKSEQIQKLMNDLLDDETKKMFELLEKMLQENADLSQIQKNLEQMNRQEINLEKELERTLELFKQMQYDFKFDQSIQELKDLNEKQEELLNDTKESLGEKPESKDSKDSKEKSKTGEESEKPKDNTSLAQDQQKLREDFEKFKESLKDLEKLGGELDKQDELPKQEDLEQIDKSQENTKESLEQNKLKKAAESQKNTINQMKQMRQQMESTQGSMEMEMDMENLEALKQIIHGLIKLSFDQENLLKDFNVIQQTDPKYLTLSQNQLKVKDDSKVLEDSLLALGKRDPFMGSVVTKEIGNLNDHLDKSISFIKDRRKSNASSEMQLSMTSINNLALLLNDHYNMMMNMMANASPSKGKGKGKMPKNMSDLQRQLNQQMEEMKNGKMQGRQLSEQLAKMAAEQERIRRALQEMQQKLQKEGGKVPGDDIPGKMEQTEMDLVNKQITERTIMRQKEILTRLLETEKAAREQDMEEERKGETAKDYTKEIPRAFEDYLRLKEKELELLKTVPPKLYPYYKKEVNKYFERINNE